MANAMDWGYDGYEILSLRSRNKSLSMFYLVSFPFLYTNNNNKQRKKKPSTDDDA